MFNNKTNKYEGRKLRT
uniref:Uncharacterized protein n=1 Tax=Arundo donax TaxID=35708 RepID=A0A0A9B0H6_ARUDO